jgi:hypothetical protein
LLRYSVVCAAVLLARTVYAQEPLPNPPSTPTFFSRYDFELSAAALANDDDRFSWDTHFAGNIDAFDYVFGRIGGILDYQAVLGSEFRPFDPYQSNYNLEANASYRWNGTEFAALFHHVSRHLGDRPKEFPIAWNVLGIRVLRQFGFRGMTFDVVADIGGTTQRVYVDYTWVSNASVVVRRPLSPRTGLFARGFSHANGVTGERDRGTQAGGGVELGIRFVGQAAHGELYGGYERRFDADPVDFQPQRWFLVGFRVLRR